MHILCKYDSFCFVTLLKLAAWVALLSFLPDLCGNFHCGRTKDQRYLDADLQVPWKRNLVPQLMPEASGSSYRENKVIG